MIAVENILELDAQQQRQLTEDLASVGITSQAAVQNVFVTSVDGDLKNTLGHQLRVRKNTLIFGQSGWGKALPNYQGVLTPDGYKPISEIKVGDLVASNDGKFYPVLGVYPQGKQPVYEITFNYNRKCRCSDEHIWTISRDCGKTYHNETLKEILSNGFNYKDNDTDCIHHETLLPPVQTIELKNKELGKQIKEQVKEQLCIYNIEYIADEECTCIKVAAPNHLFLTEHCIPTHNTQIVEQVADELGYEIVKLTASTKVPEDFGGRPMGNTENLSPELRRAIANRNIANRKAQQLFPEEITKREKQLGVRLGSAGKNQLFQKLISEQEVTEAEIDEEINNSNEVARERKREVYAAPDWVYKILDDYISKGKRTVLFLDEINQAAAETLNTLFQLVDTGKFADRREYDMSKAIVCVAAGNFRRENHSLVKLPAPLVRRFPTVIYYLGDWGVAIDYLQSKYSHNEKIVKLLEDIRLGSLVQMQSQTNTGMSDFENPATLEAAIKDLNQSMEENLYIANYKQVIRIPGKSQQLIDQFIRKNGLDDPTRVGGPQDGETLDTAQHYGDEEGTSSHYIAQINRVKKLWKDFASVKRVLIKDEGGNTKILFYTKPDHQQIYLDYLKAQEEYKDVPEDIWDILATSAPQDMGAWN